MSTPAQVYTATVAALEGASIVLAHKDDRLVHYEGPLEEMPLRDRTFVLQATGLDRVTERMGCQEWTLVLDLAVVYALTSGANARALADAQAMSDAIIAMIGTSGITMIEEAPSQLDISERFITTALAFEVSFSEGG